MRRTRKELPKRYENQLITLALDCLVSAGRDAGNIAYGILHSDTIEERIEYAAKLMAQREVLSKHEDEIDLLTKSKIADIKEHFRDDLAKWKARKAAKSR